MLKSKLNKRIKKICFVSLNSYPLLVQKDLGFIGGGAEKRFVLIAKKAAKQGFNVSFITYGTEGKSIEYINNIMIIKVYQRDDTRHLNLLVKVWQIWKAMKKADADIYLEGPGLRGIVSLFCRLLGRKSIFPITSNFYLMRKPNLLGRKLRFAFAHRFGIKLANLVIAQSEAQSKMLSDNFNRESIVIKNPLQLTTKEVPSKAYPIITIWVAELSKFKQAELFLKLAKAIPEAKFQMIGGPRLGEEGYYNSIQEATSSIPNLDFLGFIPPYNIDHYFARASILVNTSVSEGFPNTFLEAWAAYTPVVTLNSDPDEIICRFRLGLHSKSLEQMINDVELLLLDKELRTQMGKDGRNYVEQEHDIEKIVSHYLTLFE